MQSNCSSSIINANPKKIPSTLDKMVHAPFKKIVKFVLICMELGSVMGMGLGAFLASNL